jgi:hypothetical protein
MPQAIIETSATSKDTKSPGLVADDGPLVEVSIVMPCLNEAETRVVLTTVGLESKNSPFGVNDVDSEDREYYRFLSRLCEEITLAE